ncbi:SIMPL domain-containing protein [Cognatilysobacter lacus]|uniref:SIMPL domain-containing protein n=1 Tax=Cognatilysobacter lacus TaxID=1643323 RepID=A0A5D8YWC7_9GAMM|nr:SIMPL domain-containing protein [Lysobacter lacus]TZF87045.1 SIMPL domain-containing protein [Lysobacter lacus]
MRLALRSLALATVLAFGSLAMTVDAQTVAVPTYAADGTLLSVSAQAEARRAPDIATVSAGVVTQAADANGALRQNAEQMAKVVAAIRAAGVAERDVQTAGVNLNPQYRYVENQPPAITGYQASNNVNVIVRDIAKLGRILDALVANGANQINGPTFDIDQKEPVLDEARRAALEKARKRADMYAQSLGMHVRRIVSIDETGGASIPRPVPMMAMAKMARDEATPISPGENVLSVSLNVVFELGK